MPYDINQLSLSCVKSNFGHSMYILNYKNVTYLLLLVIVIMLY